MRTKIKQLMKRGIAGLAAFAIAMGSVSVAALHVRAEEADAVPVANYTSCIPGEIVLENTGGDNLVLLQPLSAEDEFAFGADVTFTNPDEQQSAALIFGIRDNNLDDGHAIKANIHKKIDWNVPARVWGYGTDELRCPGENGQANRFFEDNRIDVTQTFRMEVFVQKNSENQYVLTYSLTNTDGEKVTAAQGILKDSYTGGRFGLMTFASRAVFSNITVDGQKYGALETAEGVHTIHGVNGDAHIVSDVKLEPEQGFTYETDIDLAPDTCSAALTFGIQNRDNPGEAWIGANFNFNDYNGAGGARVFQVGNGAADIGSASLEGKLDRSRTIHAKLHVSSAGLVTYELYNTDTPENRVTVTGALGDYQGGYLGLLTFDSSAVFTNTSYALDEEIPADSDFKTNLGELTYAGGSGAWIMTENGLYSDATGRGDCFAFSQVPGTNFVYATDIDFDGTEGAAALVFRSNNDPDQKECYAFNIDVGSHRCKFWRWQKNDALQLIDEKEVPATADETYTLKVVAYDSWILCYVNDQLIASTGDYVLQPGNRGQNTVIKDGFFGLLNWNSKVTFQNTYYQELSGDLNPILTDINVTSDLGTVEEKTQFTPTEPITIQYVKNDVQTVNIEVTRASEEAVVEVRDADGTVYADGRDIPVKEGSNYLTVTSTVTAENGMTATVTYRVNVHRFKADEIYYNEAYRDQYHYSVKEGWANDPNGLVYFNGTYHMFYQFYDGIRHGPMHWAHATSTDLIHWEEEPIALYPDANGAMFSGCIVVDENNTSGLFDGIEGGGLVALITADGNGQRIKLAYSHDDGKTWTKVDEIAADWTDDPLKDAAFRDPKVFRWEGKWFMVIAGGPLRIYSSDDLRSWTCEAAYADLHTECPDLYPIEAPDGQIKWVLSRGGRFYKVGDFNVVDGNWRFVPDAEYANSDGVMNFGRDFYAAMTYYVQDFGTAADPTLPELVELNWMNTWDDYCNQVAEKVGKDFNGTFNLNLKLGLKKDGEKYVLTQIPISGYETLRETDKKLEWTQVTVEENNTLLKDFVGDTYEIIARFYPEEGTRKVGFKVRTGEGEETLIVYDLETQSLSLDRRRSGVIISSKFAEVTSQNVTKNADGTLDLHIYVDKASVEVFAKDYTAAGSAQIFPSPLSVGAEVFVEGEAAKADITIYPLTSIWTDKAEVTEPQYIGTTSATSQNLYVGGSVKLNVYVLPTSVSQEVTWSVKEGNEVAEVDAAGTVTALKKGTAVVVAASKANPELTREFTIHVTENNFKTNISEFVNVSGNWNVDDETLSVSNGGQNDYYMSAEKIQGDFILETDIRYTRGLFNLFLASENLNPHEGAGAYTVQFGYDTNVRLFPFGRDDFGTGTMASPINDGAYHHVKVVKEGQTILVYVDDVKCLEHTFETTEAFFANGHVGIGLWDGALDVQNFFVNPPEEPIDPSEPETEPSEPSQPDPIVITTQPADYVGLVGDTAVFTVVAEGEDLSYQWYFSKDGGETWEKSSGTSAALTMEYKAYRNNYLYRCEITDAEGNAVISDAAKLSAREVELVMVSQPADYVGAVNDNVAFTVEATGNGLVYEWFYSDDAGATWAKSYSPGYMTNELAVVLRSHRDGNLYKCLVTDIFGNSMESNAVSMTVRTGDVTIIQQPESVENGVLGQLYSFTVVAEGENLTYRWEVSSDGGATWEKSWNQGYDTNTLDVRMYANRNGNRYRCVVTSGLKTVVISDAATLKLQDPSAAIVSQPQSQYILVNETATFKVEATGMDLTYLWYRSDDRGSTWNQTYLTGYDTDTLSFEATAARAAMYMCKVTDGSGKYVWSDPVTLQVLSARLTILTQPVNVTCAANETAVFTVEAQGDGLMYRWYYSADGGNTWTASYMTGYNTAEFSFTVTAARAARLYKCVITDAGGNTVETNAVSVTVE